MEIKYIQIPSLNPPNLIELGVRSGWFVRAGGCLIWFEILEVFSKNSVLAVSRDPKDVHEIYMTGDFFSSIYEVCSNVPSGHWIKANREKNFFDKYFPDDNVKTV